MLIQSKTASLASAELAVSVFCDKRVPRTILYDSTAVVYMMYDVNFDSTLFFYYKDLIIHKNDLENVFIAINSIYNVIKQFIHGIDILHSGVITPYATITLLCRI